MRGIENVLQNPMTHLYDTPITEGLEEAANYLHGLEFLDGPQDREDVVNCIQNMNRDNVMTISKNIFPDGHEYKWIRVVFGNKFENGTAAEGCVCSKRYKM